MTTYIINVFIYLIRENKEAIMFQNNLCQCLQLFLCINTTSRVTWRTEYDEFRFRCNSNFQLISCYLEILLYSSRNNDRYSTRQLYHLWIAYPIRSRNNNLITRINKSQDCITNALFSTRTNNYFRCRIVKVIFTFELICYRLTQR